MQAGLEYTIKFLEKSAARNAMYRDSKTNPYDRVYFDGAEKTCLSAVKTLKKKLRSVVKESVPKSHNK